MTNSKRIQRVAIAQKRLGVGSFSRINLKAYADVALTGTCPTQRIESRCEYGIYPENVAAIPEFEQDRLLELRDQLHAIGFSNRAITAAFRNVEREGN